MTTGAKVQQLWAFVLLIKLLKSQPFQKSCHTLFWIWEVSNKMSVFGFLLAQRLPVCPLIIGKPSLTLKIKKETHYWTLKTLKSVRFESVLRFYHDPAVKASIEMWAAVWRCRHAGAVKDWSVQRFLAFAPYFRSVDVRCCCFDRRAPSPGVDISTRLICFNTYVCWKHN